MHVSHQIHSKNYDLRPDIKKPIKYVILHYTELDFDSSVDKLCSYNSKVSAHYLIRKDGNIYQLVGDFYRAWHAGQSRWKQDEKINDMSIGIEIENLGYEDFTGEQYNSIIWLCLKLAEKYAIEPERFLGHSDIAPSRKIDPGMHFKWSILCKKGVGAKFEIPKCDYKKIMLTQSRIVKVKHALKSIGYYLEINQELNKEFSDVIRAFQLHFSSDSIKYQGGAEYLKQLDHIFSWDTLSEKALNSIITER